MGSEFHVNSQTAADQDNSAVGCSSNGACIVAWESFVAGDFDIRAQLYDPLGNRVGQEFVVAQTSNDELEPAVAMDNSGSFVVVWTEDLGVEADILGQRFSATGQTIGGTILVETSFRAAYDPSVARAANGDFVVTYSLDNPDADVIAKMYRNDGSLLRQLYVAGSGYEEHSANVARTADGRFAVAYQIDSSNYYSNSDVRLVRYSATGTLLGTHRVTSTFSRPESNPTVAMDNAGNAVVAYEVLVQGDWDVHARKVSNAGSLGSVIVVRGLAGTHQTRPAVAMDRFDGDFVIAYETGPYYNRSVEVVEFATTGARRGTFDLGSNRDRPSISIDGAGRYMLTYVSFDRLGDPDAGIFGRFGQL